MEYIIYFIEYFNYVSIILNFYYFTNKLAFFKNKMYNINSRDTSNSYLNGVRNCADGSS